MGCCGGGFVGGWHQPLMDAGKEPIDLSTFSKLIFVGDRIGSEEYRTKDGTRYLFGKNAFHKEQMMPTGHAEELLTRFGSEFFQKEEAVEPEIDSLVEVESLAVDEPVVPSVAEIAGAIESAMPPVIEDSGASDEPIFDFTKIKGIGEVLKNTLYDHGIMTLSEFIGTELSVLGRILPRKSDEAVQDMVSQAKAFQEGSSECTCLSLHCWRLPQALVLTGLATFVTWESGPLRLFERIRWAVKPL